ncbi:DUF4177 domain-containing protein [Clostridium sp. YIM B02551]|uniref:DUF4177 domain-containing protein n=1 Tax=Clostridium sp. YIM B02551 TaxID=2910679 RepID=UPI001EEA2951|nr:DUF4177 domain-containing protein [Clostridium sp. YIM B02551]
MSAEWKYKVFTVDKFISMDSDLSLEEELNKYGEEGWELVGIIQKPITSLGKPSKLNDNSIVFKKDSQNLNKNN